MERRIVVLSGEVLVLCIRHVKEEETLLGGVIGNIVLDCPKNSTVLNCYLGPVLHKLVRIVSSADFVALSSSWW